MSHKFKTFFRLRKNVISIVVNNEWLYIEYRPRLKCFDLIYYPDISRFKGPRGFIRVIKYRTNDHLAILGLVVKTIDEIKCNDELEKALRRNIASMTCNPCA